MASPSRVTVVDGQVGSGGMLRSGTGAIVAGSVSATTRCMTGAQPRMRSATSLRSSWPGSCSTIEAVEQRVAQGVTADAPAAGDRVVGDGRGFAVEDGEWSQLRVVKADEVPGGTGGSGESPPVFGGQAGV